MPRFDVKWALRLERRINADSFSRVGKARALPSRIKPDTW